MESAKLPAMPIRKDLRPLYPSNWREISRRVRFERAGGNCEKCRRPHGENIQCIPDGRWFDPVLNTWRSTRGRPATWPDLMEIVEARRWTVRLAAAHLDHRPQNCRMRNLRAFCQRCHLLHDLPYHLARRRITYRSRWAIGDLFDGPYVGASGAADEIVQFMQKRMRQQGTSARDDRSHPGQRPEGASPRQWALGI